jgi:tRNA A-37 threonylcarbamoyl transferase component Bud32
MVDSFPRQAAGHNARKGSLLPAEFWWSEQGEWVEPPNCQRGGISGVQRVHAPQSDDIFYVKRQSNHLFHSPRYPAGRPTLLRESINIQYCARIGVPTASLAFFDMRKDAEGWHAVLATQELRGYVSLDNAFAQNSWTATQRRRALEQVARALIRLHCTRRKHGHLYPKEVFLDLSSDTPAVAFVDWELSRYRYTRTQAAMADLQRLLRSLFERGLTQDEYDRIIQQYHAQGIDIPPQFLQRCRHDK